MSKKLILFVFLFATALNGLAQAPTFQWANSIGGSSSDNVVGVCTDTNSNVYTVGHFAGSCDFDPGTGVSNLTSFGGSDIFISKLNASGNYVLSAQIGGPNSEFCYGLDNDALGNIYLTGTFSGIVDFDPGPGTSTVATVASSISNMFVAKLDANANLIWVKQIGDGVQANPIGRSVATDAAGNVYLTGEFSGTRDFDPGVGTSNLTATTISVFVLKLDANGNFNWVQKLNAQGGIVVQTDANADVYAGGYFFGTCDMDPGAGTYTLGSFGAQDGYLVKLNTNGGFVWAKQFGGTSNDVLLNLNTDCVGNLYCAGNFETSFKPNPASTLTTFNSFGQKDIFVVKLDASGNYIWGDQLGGAFSEIQYGMTIDNSGDVYLAGSFAGGSLGGGTCDFDPSPATYTLANVGANDLFYCKLKANGNFSWAYGAGSSNGETANGICVDDNYRVLVTGNFNTTVNFNPFSPAVNISSNGSSDIFILKFLQAAPASPVNTTPNSLGGLKLCVAGSSTLLASGTGNLNWYATNTSTLSLGSGSVFVTPSISLSTTFYVAVANCDVNNIRTPITVTVNPPPTLSVTASKTLVCIGQSLVLTASGNGSSYLWNNGASSPAITITVSAATSLSVTSTSANSCTNTASISINPVNCQAIGVNISDQKNYAIYPVPAKDVVNIESQDKTILHLVNANGQLVKIITLQAGLNSVSVKDLPAGIYFITSYDAPLLKATKLVLLGD